MAFDWHGTDNPHVVLGYQPPTAVYHDGDSVRIRQQADQTEDYDPEIFLTPQGALAVAWRLIEVAHLAGVPGPSLSLMVEPERPTISREALERAADQVFGPGNDSLPPEDAAAAPPLFAEMAKRDPQRGEGRANAA
jgi:hypothetical protein